jgi:type IV pilus assembly protein PilE
MKSIKKSGFSLIELMVVVIVIAIIVTVAIPSYQAYMRRASMNQAQQEMQRLALLLDKHKAKNFTYRGFDIKTMKLPMNAADERVKYTLIVRDGDDSDLTLDENEAAGHHWVIQAQSTDVNNYTLLLTSHGVQCKNKIAAQVDFISCGADQEEW